MARKADPWVVKQRRGYWYYRLRGEEHYHSTGIQIDNWKRTKPKAEQYAQEHAGTGPVNGQYETFADFAAPYFLPDSCPWFAREHGRNNEVQQHYRDQHRSRLEIHILPQFGRLSLGELSPVAIERWLSGLNYATQTKKHILRTFQIMLADMRRDRLISFAPSEIKPPVVRHEERAIPTDDEAAALFPSDFDVFRLRWNNDQGNEARTGNRRPKGSRLRMGIMLALAYSSGMRISELRALSPLALHHDLGGLVVVETVTRDDRLGPPKAKSVRAIPLPIWTLDLLSKLPASDSPYLFPGHRRGTYLDLSSANHALTAVCRKLNINTALTPHGLRHGYNTRMRSILAEGGFDPYFDERTGFRATTRATDDVLRAFTGHRSPNMTDLYDHPELLRALSFYRDHFRDYVNHFWDFRG